MNALFQKEFKEHGLSMAVLTVLEVGLFLFFLLMFHLNPNRGSYLFAFRGFMMLGFPLGALYVGSRFIAREYTGKTQFFLEALPVSRFQVFGVKWLLSLLFTAIPVYLAFLICLLITNTSEVLAGRHVLLLFARTSAYLLFFHTGSLAVGFLGRYRIPGLITLIFLLLSIDLYTDVNLVLTGPLSLLYDERFCFERELLPAADLISALAGSVFFTAVSLAMALTREGSMAAMLALKMSHREKVFVACMVIGTMITIMALDERSIREPFQLKESITATGQGPAVSISSGNNAEDEELQILTNQVQAVLAEVRQYLDLDQITPVFLTIRNDLDPDVYETGDLEGTDGLLVRLRYVRGEFNLQHFLTWLIPQTLIHSTDGRALLEKNRWLLDGFALFIMNRGNPEQIPRPLLMRALFGTPLDLDEKMLNNWLSFRETVGEEVASGVAWYGLQAFEKLAGANACRQFLQVKLGIEHRFFQATLHEMQHPIADEIRHASGFAYAAFIEAWQEDLELHRLQFPNALQTIPTLAGELNTVTLSPNTRRLEFRLAEGTDLDETERVTFRYLPLGLHDEEIHQPDVLEEEMTVAKMLEWQMLPHTYPRGTRLAWSFTISSEILDCDITTGWNRMELP